VSWSSVAVWEATGKLSNDVRWLPLLGIHGQFPRYLPSSRIHSIILVMSAEIDGIGSFEATFLTLN
jgi:hypothetical protein